MKYIFLFAFVVFIYYDTIILMRKSHVFFDHYIGSWKKWVLLAFIFSVLMLPFYLRRREEYYWALIESDEDIQETAGGNPQFIVKFEAIGIFLNWIFYVALFSAFWAAYELINQGKDFELLELVVSAIMAAILMVFLIYRTLEKYGAGYFREVVALKKSDKPWLVSKLLPAFLGVLFAYVSTVLMNVRLIQPSTPLGEVLDANQSMGLFFLFIGAAIVCLFLPPCDIVSFSLIILSPPSLSV